MRTDPCFIISFVMMIVLIYSVIVFLHIFNVRMHTHIYIHVYVCIYICNVCLDSHTHHLKLNHKSLNDKLYFSHVASHNCIGTAGFSVTDFYKPAILVGPTYSVLAF